MTDATGTATRTYDTLNRNITKNVPGIGSSTYNYDLPAATQGEYSERTTDPKGNVTLKTYDKVGRLSKVTVANGVTGYQYYANGSQQLITYPDGTTENYSYDRDNRITTLINAKADNTVISSYQYTYDAAGNQTSKQEAKGTTAYTYDKLNRLVSVTEPDYRITSYTYDQAGNRKSEKVEKGLLASITLYTYDSVNRLINTSSSDGTGTIYSYDPNGNLISKSLGENQITYPEKLTLEDLPDFGLVIRRDSTYGTGSKNLTTYTYDNYNRLIETKSENTSSTYGYNAQGYRVEKEVNKKVTKYLYESDKVVLETDANGVQTAYQTYGNSLLYRSVAAGGEQGAEGYYYLYNAHGDVTGLLDAGGTIAATYDYDAFGNILSETGQADNSTKYAGYQYDKESGLYYLNARYYDSVTARFITEDTYTGQKNDPLSLNLYTYCSNNPIKYYDPTGHMNYLTQSDNLLEGVIDGCSDSITAILKSPKAIYDIAKSVKSGEISTKDLVKAGLGGLVDDYVYVVKNSSVLDPKKKVSNVKVEEYGEHLGAIVTDLAMALSGAGATKVVKVLSKTKAGAEIVKTLDKVEDVAKATDKAAETAKVTEKAETATNVTEKVEIATKEAGNVTIWDNITGTAKNLPGTEIPATFQIKLDKGISYTNPTTGSNVLWTNANATKHMGEYISRFGAESESIGIRSQAMLESYSASLNKVMADLSQKAPGRYFETYGNWELGINTETGVVYHAKMIK